MGDYAEGLAPVAHNGYYDEFIDRFGRIVIKVPNGCVDSFSEGLAVFWGDHTCGYIGKTGAIVIEPQYVWASDFHEGLAAVKTEWTGYGCGFIDQTGRFVIPPQYGSASVFSEGLAGVAVGTIGIDALIYDIPEGTWGFIDVSGEFVIEPQFTSVYDFRGGLALVATLEGNWEYIDTAGTVVCSWPASLGL